jgi:hypothetical protein
MIKGFEFYHGAAITRLVHSQRPLSIKVFPGHGNASYIVNDRVGLYLKYSSKRLSPWAFSFQKEHQSEIDELKSKCPVVIVGLICHDDGIVGLSYLELKTILDDKHERVEWVSASRKPRGQYAIKGKDGRLLHKVSEGEFIAKVLELQ